MPKVVLPSKTLKGQQKPSLSDSGNLMKVRSGMTDNATSISTANFKNQNIKQNQRISPECHSRPKEKPDGIQERTDKHKQSKSRQTGQSLCSQFRHSPEQKQHRSKVSLTDERLHPWQESNQGPHQGPGKPKKLKQSLLSAFSVAPSPRPLSFQKELAIILHSRCQTNRSQTHPDGGQGSSAEQGSANPQGNWAYN